MRTCLHIVPVNLNMPRNASGSATVLILSNFASSQEEKIAFYGIKYERETKRATLLAQR